MADSFQQTNTAVACAIAAFCSGRAVGAGPTGDSQATIGGTAGATAVTVTASGSSTDQVLVYFECIVPAGENWNAGTWTVRLNITTASALATLTWDEVYICRISSGCASQATIGSATALAIALNTTGVKSATVTGTAQTPAAGDKVAVVLVFSNSNSMSKTFSYTPDQLIDSPFTTPSVLDEDYNWTLDNFTPLENVVSVW